MTDNEQSVQKRKPKERLEKLRKKRAQVKQKIKNVLAKKTQGKTMPVVRNKLELIVTIVERGKAEYYLDLLQSFEINMQCVALGHGTADAKTLGILGVSGSEKAVIFGVIQESKVEEAFRTLEEKFQTIKNGKGIAYTLPFSSVIGTLIYGFLSNNRMAVKEEK